MREETGPSGVDRRRHLMIVALWFATIAVCAIGARLAGAADPDAAALVDANQRRFQAMIDRNLPELEAMLHDNLVYTHSTGVVESRQEALASLASDRFIYRRIEAQDLRPIVVGDTGVITGLAQMQVAVGGEVMEGRLRFTAVYVRSDQSESWQLIAWQSTRIDPPRQLESTSGESVR